MTVDELIERLERARDELGGDRPVLAWSPTVGGYVTTDNLELYTPSGGKASVIIH